MTDAFQNRIRSASLVALLHVLLGLAFLNGLAFDLVTRPSDELKTFDVLPEPPPPRAPEPPPQPESDAEEGEAAPPDLRAQPTPVVAPEPIVKQPTLPPIAAAPIAGQGSAPSAGAAQLPGPGTGAGGEGTGTGSGGRGGGTGSGGVASGAQHIAGKIVREDYPRAASRARVEGISVVLFDVRLDGHVENCRVLRSSGSLDLDDTTCSLIEERFRFLPARDERGRPISSTIRWTQEWWLTRRRRPPSPAPSP